MNKLLKAKHGLKGGIKGTKFQPQRAAGKGGNLAQPVAKAKNQHKLAGNSNSDKC